MKKLWKLGVFALTIAALFPASYASAAGGDGPRAYQLVPTGTKSGRFLFMSLDGNQTFSPGAVLQNSDINVNVGAFQYTQTFDVNGNSFGAFFVLSAGSVEGSFDLGGGAPARLTGDQSGLFDLQIGAVYGFVGSPALNSPAEFASHEPGLQIGLLGKAFLPVGAYDSDQVLNTGANRYAFQIGLPTTYVMGQSLLDPNRSTIEVLPSVTFFGDNNTPFGGSGSTGQDPIFTVEAHYTRNFGASFWASLDAIYEYGGKTSTNGVSNDDRQEAFSVGLSVNHVLPSGVNLQASYGEVIWNNNNGPEGSLLRLSVITVF
jgi:hypothetical protein